MATRPSTTIAKSVTNIDPIAKTATVSWVRFVYSGETGYDFDTFAAIGSWTATGTGSASINSGLADWTYDNNGLELHAHTGQEVTVESANGYFSDGMLGTTDYTYEVCMDTTNINSGDLQFYITSQYTTLHFRIQGNDMMIGSDSQSGYWKFVRNDMGPGIYRLRMHVRAPNLAGSNVGVWRQKYVAGVWQPWELLLLDTYYVTVPCDKAPAPPIATKGDCMVYLKNSGVSDSTVVIDSMKVKNDDLAPIDMTLGESAWWRYEIHVSTTPGFVPDVAGGTTRIAAITPIATTSTGVSGLYGGAVNYIKVVVVETAVNPQDHYSVSNEIQAIVPSASMTYMFATILGFKKKVANAFSRVVGTGSARSFLFASAKLFGEARTFAFSTVRGTAVKNAFAFLLTHSSSANYVYQWARVLTEGVKSAYGFLQVKAEAKMSAMTWFKIMRETRSYANIWVGVGYRSRRRVYLWVSSKMDPNIYNAWVLQYKKSQCNSMWTQQLHGDINS